MHADGRVTMAEVERAIIYCAGVLDGWSHAGNLLSLAVPKQSTTKGH